MFENPRRGGQARNLTKNVPKILDLKSSSEQIFFEKLTLGTPDHILWLGTYLYTLYKGLPPPRPRAKNPLQIMSLAAYASETDRYDSRSKFSCEIVLEFQKINYYQVERANSSNFRDK